MNLNSLNNNSNINNSLMNSMSIDKDNKKSILNNSKLRYSEYGNENKELNKSILNITEVVEENNYLKDMYSDLNVKKANLLNITKENKLLSNEISSINMQIFQLGRIFAEGMYEIGVELRKIQEIQLNKVIKKQNYGNSLYFELVKDILPPNTSGSCYPVSKDFKLPIIHNNINKKYAFPIIEKSDPKTFIYNVIKNMIEEHQLLNRNLNIKKKKFEYDEFLTFTPYQIYTLLVLNKDAIRELERRIFPKSLSVANISK